MRNNVPKGLNEVEVHLKSAYPDLYNEKPKGSNVEIIDVPIDKLQPNQNQTRLLYNDFKDKKILENEDIINLADNIKKFGLQQPIGVQEVSIRLETGEIKQGYEVIFGHRRVYACIKNNFQTIKAILYKKEDMENFEENGLDLERKFIFNIIENLQREELNIIEEAMIYKKIIENYRELEEKTSIQKIAQLLGIKPLKIYRALKIEKSLHQDIIDELSGTIRNRKKPIKKDIVVLQRLSNLKDYPKEQIKLWNSYQEDKINRDMTLEYIEAILKGEQLSKKRNQKSFEGGIRFKKDNQGLKIRYEKIIHLEHVAQYELQKQIASLITDFMEKREKKQPQSKIPEAFESEENQESL
ncbi:hypothetical protein BKH42_03450 [Helicobacter sp. 13S00482-2]|uniref:ParB/RepB/Spo0J family partition protein n=1 Tax=Helicobacter sp. 13S00482-2 TaxID=1476200 RepID=UPI000BA61E31|nr:ParB/RepB/Spo0J family partition protein [Helicobacter sp. 13S00482-2]PAF53796.1 hypothetical protein BKH42_03450 [Helicobacter sp. 13S00482-2]